MPQATSPMRGRATPEGTRRYAASHPGAEGYYRTWRGLELSSLGFGSYLGRVDADARTAYEEAAHVALATGVNVVDTAINYRNQQSERDVGRALRRLGRREEHLVVTKGGFLPLDADSTLPPHDYVRRTYVEPGLLAAEDLVGGVHSMAPRYLADQLSRSLQNLGLESVDVYLLHNPETQLQAGADRPGVHRRLRAAFEALEQEVEGGRIGAYGLATWDGFRVPPGDPGHLPLETMLQLAQEARDGVGPGDHHLGAIELPVNVAMPEAAQARTQLWGGELVPALEAARRADLLVLASASLLQGRLLGRLPPFVRQALGAGDDVEAAIEFARSCPGVTTALVGMGRPSHAKANAAAMLCKTPAVDALPRLLGG